MPPGWKVTLAKSCHLATRRRKPSEYEIVSANLHYGKARRLAQDRRQRSDAFFHLDKRLLRQAAAVK